MKANKNFWRGKNVLVTGCYGFLASNIIIYLLKKGANIVGISNDYIPVSLLCLGSYDKKISIVPGSITNHPIIKRVLNEYEIQVCFHLAATAVESFAKNFPLNTFETNIKGTWCVLESARECRTIESVVIASSDKAYGEHKKLPYKEDYLLVGFYPYDASKVCAETLAKAYFHAFNLPIAITRCGNLYGPGDFHWSRIIPGTIRSLIHNEAPIIRSDGTPVRDYFYIEDAVSAYLTLAEKVVKKPEVRGDAFNFSCETPITALDLVKMLISLHRRSTLRPRILGKDKPFTEIHAQYLSSEKARRALGWKAKYSLKEGLKKTIAWYKSYFKNK
ncbi:MAG: NAD-dependent epimerase/dehydratase family protein [Elusimicrobiota bacterium]